MKTDIENRNRSASPVATTYHRALKKVYRTTGDVEENKNKKNSEREDHVGRGGWCASVGVVEV